MTEERVRDDVLLSAWLDGELEAEAALALEERLATDTELAARLRALQRVDEGLRALPEAAVPGGARDRLRARIEAEPQERRDAEPLRPAHAERPSRPPPLARPGRLRRSRLPAVVGLAAAAALLFLLLRPGSAPEPHWPEGLAGAPSQPAEPATPPALPERLAERTAPAGDAELAPEALDLERDWVAAVEPPSEEPVPALEAPTDEAELALDLAADDVPVVEVLDWLEALDELEGVERG